eukprot:GFYU01000804.1.p1 GENE.GFYU01000804.1~~GFYU01000804.1.p1  ORF type:complete len:773 (+),score=236.18 GFYU01000804.1:115-2433(+)
MSSPEASPRDVSVAEDNTSFLHKERSRSGDRPESPVAARAASPSHTNDVTPPPPALSRGFDPKNQIYMEDTVFSGARRTYELVIIFPNKHDNAETTAEYHRDRNFILHRLRRAGLLIALSKTIDGDETIARITAPEEILEIAASQCHLNVKLKEKYGGGYVDFRDFLEFRTRAEDAVNGDDDEDRMLGTEDLAKAHDMLEISESYSKFRHAQRQQLIYFILQSKKRGGAGLDIGHFTQTGVLQAMFPLHEDDKLDALADKWAYELTGITQQPIEEIRLYFGERIALYFAWLGFYTKWLIVPSLFGLILFIVQVQNDNFDNAGVPVYCCFLALWATFFLEFWKREQVQYAVNWGMTDYEEEEFTRPQFVPDAVKEIAGEEQPVYATWKRLVKFAIGLPIILAFATCVVITVLGVLLFRIVMAKVEPTFGGVAAGMMNAILINFFNWVYQRVAERLTDWENYQTDTQYEDSIIAKTFVFQFVNSYVSLFYIAFFKEGATIFGVTDHCKVNDHTGHPDCIRELSTQLGSIFITRMVIGNFMEVGLPYLKRQYATYKELKEMEAALAEQGHTSPRRRELPPTEEQAKMPPYASTFDDYCEMIIQFGYVTMFACAFPLMSALALLNNIGEIRIDAIKLCSVMQRPMAKGAEDIGTWYGILEITSVFAVMVNCAMFSLGSNQLAHMDFSHRIWVAVIAEHLLLALKFGIAYAIPDVPQTLTDRLKEQDYRAKVELKLMYDDEEFAQDLEETLADGDFDDLWESEELRSTRRSTVNSQV